MDFKKLVSKPGNESQTYLRIIGINIRDLLRSVGTGFKTSKKYLATVLQASN
ncbi:hypothetical protein LEP1GSC168_2654 [Leptospira santarosai str. HAI134]|nr:hypothetical protein LEP1GSC168_2654 [Leptospira santarosai str. HAI134]